MPHPLIQDFVKLPGIIGLSLMENGESLGHSIGLTAARDPTQQPKLARSIQKILATAPAMLNFFTFQFAGDQQVAIYWVAAGRALIILRQGAATQAQIRAVNQLLQFIKADYRALISTDNPPNDTQTLTDATGEGVNAQEILQAMNILTRQASYFLGPSLVAAHLKADQPANTVWLNRFHIESNGTISLAPHLAPPDWRLTAGQLQIIRQWMQNFCQRCTKIVRDYLLIIQQALSKQQWQLLFEP